MKLLGSFKAHIVIRLRISLKNLSQCLAISQKAYTVAIKVHITEIGDLERQMVLEGIKCL